MKNILLIQTGGTIAMSSKTTGNEFDSDSWSELFHRQFPELKSLANVDSVSLFSVNSSDINASHWVKLADCIELHYNKYDGFVILHGTDTMAFTASALSFGLNNLHKPVVLTGSQLPMSNIRSDAKRNLINAIEIAKTGIPEVLICFNNVVLRGNRATKQSISDFDAFISFNFPPLAHIGADIHLDSPINLPAKPFKNTAKYSDEIFVLNVFPSMKTAFLDHLSLNDYRAVIIRGFGSGNLPVNGEYGLIPFIEKCTHLEIIAAVGSQALRNSVHLEKYPPGRTAQKAGAVSCGNMTFEASVTKMSYLLAHFKEKAEVELQFARPLAGEISLG